MIIIFIKIDLFYLVSLLFCKNIMQIQYNVLVVGNNGVGKTLFIQRFK